MRMILAAQKRCEDWKREQRIAGLAEQLRWLIARSRNFTARMVMDEMRAEIAQRSPEQVARMERKRGLR